MSKAKLSAQSHRGLERERLLGSGCGPGQSDSCAPLQKFFSALLTIRCERERRPNPAASGAAELGGSFTAARKIHS